MTLLFWLLLIGRISLPVTHDDYPGPPKPIAVQEDFPGPPKPIAMTKEDFPHPPRP